MEGYAMESSTDIRSRRRRTGRITGAAVASLLIAGLVTGCTTTPQAVLWIPFTYTAENRITIEYPSGSTFTVVVACLDEASAVRIETLGSARLDWDGGSWATPAPDGHVVVTPVLQPGCGTLHIGPIFLHASWPVTVTVSKV